MILNRQKFDFNGRTLIEKFVIQPPFHYDIFFQDEGCFLNVSGASPVFNAPNQSIEIKSEEAVILSCGSFFVDWPKSNGSSCTVHAVHLYPEILKSIYRDELPTYILQKECKSFIHKILPENILSRFVESIDFYFDTPELVNQELLELKIRELILILIQTRNVDSVFQIVSEMFTPQKTSLHEVVNYHIYSHITIDKLAELSNMSVSTFKRNFKKIFNDTPINYINTKRLERAKELLTTSNASVSEIAFEIGYADPAFFSRLFKKNFRVSPSHFGRIK